MTSRIALTMLERVQEEQAMGLLPQQGPEVAEAMANYALVLSEQELIARVARSAEVYAEQILESDEDEDVKNDQSAALRYFAAKLREDVPAHSATARYSPADNDVVEIRVIGNVERTDAACPCECAAHCWELVTDDGVAYGPFGPYESVDFSVFRITTDGTPGESA